MGFAPGGSQKMLFKHFHFSASVQFPQTQAACNVLARFWVLQAAFVTPQQWQQGYGKGIDQNQVQTGAGKGFGKEPGDHPYQGATKGFGKDFDTGIQKGSLPDGGKGPFLDKGKGFFDKGKGFFDKGKGFLDKGKGFLDKGKGFLDKGKGFLEKGKGFLDKGKGFEVGHQTPGQQQRSKPGVDEFLSQHMEERLQEGLCSSCEEMLDSIVVKFGGPRPRADEIQALQDLLRKEQAIRQYLLSVKAHCAVWSVSDMQGGFLRSTLCAKEWDVSEWRSLRIGPSLVKHPVLAEVFKEFQAAQAADEPDLLGGADMLELLLEHRRDAGFTEAVSIPAFVEWLAQTKGVVLESRGVAINPRKARLVFAGQNAALKEMKRLRLEAEERYLAALADVSVQDIQEEAYKLFAQASDFKQAGLRFLARWKASIESHSFEDVLPELLLWARHSLGCKELPPFVSTLAAAFVAALQADGQPEAPGAPPGAPGGQRRAAAEAGKTASPQELAETIRRHLEELPPPGCLVAPPLDARGLLRLEEAVAGPGGSVEALLPGGTSLLRLIAENDELRELLDQRLFSGSGAGGASGEGAGDGQQSLALTGPALLESAAAVFHDMQPRWAVVDASTAAKAEQRLRAKLGRAQVADWDRQGSLCALMSQATSQTASRNTSFGRGSRCSWSTRLDDCRALRLWKQHVEMIDRTGGMPCITHHFGETSPLAVGMPKQQNDDGDRGSNWVRHVQAPGISSSQWGQGVFVEAAVLSKLALVHAREERKRCQTDTEVQDVFDEAVMSFRMGQEEEQECQLGAGPLGAVDAEAGLAALAAVGFLEDVEKATAWEELYRPSLGTLVDFVQAQAEGGTLADRGISLLAVAPVSLAAARLVPHFVRLPAQPDTEQLTRAAECGDPTLTAAFLSALCVSDPGDAATFSYHIDRGLKGFVAASSGGQGQAFGASGADGATVLRAAFCVALLQQLPCALCAAVGKVAVLPCFQNEVRAALTAARHLRCSRMLGLLGHRWGVPEWAEVLREPPCAADEGSRALLLRALGVQQDSSAQALPDVGQIAPITEPGPSQQAHGAADKVDPTPASGEVISGQAGAGDTTPASMTATGSGSGDAAEAPPDEPACVAAEEVERIRRGFLLDQAGASQLQLNLGGSLQRLGEDLYREQHHFVFELLQNADDCTYVSRGGEDGLLPRFKLVLQEGQLVALSNEVGFQQKDVQALCSVDRSSKPQSADGRERIGRKGIGFKSVFKITDKPVVHSGPWHFCFNALLESPHGVNLKGLGYIVPQLLPPGDRQFDGWTTEIRLPFKKRLEGEELKQLQRDLAALEGVLLLNLNTLRLVELQDLTPAGMSLGTGQQPRVLQRFDLRAGMKGSNISWRLVRIQDGDHYRDWLSVVGSFPFTSGSGTGINRCVHITISFPLPASETTAEWISEEPRQLPTFCYLPLRSFGWRVALHSNFDVTASRNELHDNSPWNVRIKELLPQMFTQAAQLVKEMLVLPVIPASKLESGQARDALAQPLSVVNSAGSAEELVPNPGSGGAGRAVRCVPYAFLFRFLPLPGELGSGESDFFRGLEARLWQRLQKEHCVLASDGTWVEPRKAVQAPASMQEVLHATKLAEHCDGLRYLHPEFVGLKPEAAKQLGIVTLASAFDVLLKAMRNMADTGDPLSQDPTWVRRALTTVYDLVFGKSSGAATASQQRMTTSELAQERMGKLKLLRILPVISGDGSRCLAAATDRGLFLPKGEDAAAGMCSSLSLALDLKLVDPLLFEGDEGRLVRGLLVQCGLGELSPPALLVDGLLPFLSQELEACHAEVLADCLCALAVQRESFHLCEGLWRSAGQRRGAGSSSFEEILRRAIRLPCRQALSADEGGESDVVGFSWGPLKFLPCDCAAVLPPVFHDQLRNAPPLRLCDSSVGHAGQKLEDRSWHHSVLARTPPAAITGSLCLDAQLLLDAMARGSVQPNQLAGFLLDFCGVGPGIFPMEVMRAKRFSSKEELANFPHLAKKVRQWQQEQQQQKSHPLEGAVDVSAFPLVGQDYSSPALERVLATIGSDSAMEAPGSRASLHELVASSFALGLSKCMLSRIEMTAESPDLSGRVASLSTASPSFRGSVDIQGPSSIAAALSNIAAWVPCEGNRWAKPNELFFMPQPALGSREQNFLRAEFLLPASPLTNLRPLLEMLGVREVVAEDVLNLLRQWSAKQRSPMTEGRLTSAYLCLHKLGHREQSGRVRAAFTELHEPLIFVPRTTANTKKGGEDKNLLDGTWICAESCCVAQLSKKRVAGSEIGLSDLGAVRELALHYAICLKQPFIDFGVTEWPTFRHFCSSIELAGQGRDTEVAIAMADKAFSEIKGKIQGDEERQELRQLLSLHCALFLTSGQWVKWFFVAEDGGHTTSADDAVKVYLPHQGASRECCVLSPRLQQHFRFFKELGMEMAPTPETAPVLEQTSSPLGGDSSATVTSSGHIADSEEEIHLRTAVAYIQCFIFLHLSQAAYQDCERKVSALPAIEFHVSDTLTVNGSAAREYYDAPAGRLHVRSQGQRGAELRAALRCLVARYLGIAAADSRLLAAADSVGLEVLIRLAESKKPGLASKKVLTSKGISVEDPASLAIRWWLGRPPLPLEEELPTLAVSPGRLGEQTGGRASGALSASGTGSLLPGRGGIGAGNGTDLRWLRLQAEQVASAVEGLRSAEAEPAPDDDCNAAALFRCRVACTQPLADLRCWAPEKDGSTRGLQGTSNWTGIGWDASGQVDTAAHEDGQGAAAAQQDPWAAWAATRAGQVGAMLNDIETWGEAAGHPAGPSAVEKAHLEACRQYVSKTLSAPDALEEFGAHSTDWFLEQAQHLEEAARLAVDLACRSGAVANGLEESGHDACAAHALELRRWAAAGRTKTGGFAPSHLGTPGARTGAPDSHRTEIKWAQERAGHLLDTVQQIEARFAQKNVFDSEGVEEMRGSLRCQIDSLQSWAESRPWESKDTMHKNGQAGWSLASVESARLVEDAALDIPEPLPGIDGPGLQEWQEREVAEWGEKFVYQWLCRKHTTSPGVQVTWMNEDIEKFNFYDISVDYPDGHQQFFEVKSTIKADKPFTEISEKQIIEAARLKERLTLVRVLRAGSRCPQMMLFPNPSAQWHPQHKVETGVELQVRLPLVPTAFMTSADGKNDERMLQIGQWRAMYREWLLEVHQQSLPLPLLSSEELMQIWTFPPSENALAGNKKCTCRLAATDKYYWSQSLSELTLEVDVGEPCKAADVKVDITATRLSVKYNGKSILEGKLHEKVSTEECMWQLEGQQVIISLDKSRHTWWKCVLQGDQEIDTTKVESTRSMEEYDGETQGAIRKIMFDQNQKIQGKPNSDQIRTAEMMKDAWNAPSSPFRGTEFDPTMLNLSGPVSEDFFKDLEKKKIEMARAELSLQTIEAPAEQ
ncbi:unnamed protein product [Polarella glacialis]|uniref:CS domain-containing protein n=1 Tax=Polarella glacialis TaxID=89957 RepID=A0A813JP10_POLGL|nr:unnamed protein product [Polarella glacialis]